MSADRPDDTQTRDRDFAAMWSSDGATRSFSPSATGSGLPADLPFLFAPGQTFGPYKIVRPLGKGGMGQVYEAEETESGRRVAMKILSRGLGDDEERERFLREGRLAASLSHPNTVYVFGTTEVQGFPVIAMELAPGGTLKELLVGGTPVAFATAVDAIVQVIAGLDAAARIGILHRDVKPSNCFVHGDGRVLVGDFGLSVATSSRGRSAASGGTILGTPGFASPEQLRGDALDVRSDIYSVGATMFYLLAGRAPFDDQTTTSLIARITSEPPPLLTEVRADVPKRLALVVAKCLAKTPEERYAGYAALTAALEPFSSARLRPAPLARRAAAGAIDLYIAALPVIALERYAGVPPLSTSYPAQAALFAVTALIVMTLYFGWFEGHMGASPAKALFGLRVVDPSNSSPGIARGMRRALAFAAPVQILTRGVLWLLLIAAPNVAVGFAGKLTGVIALAALFATARRSNGYTALHDRVTGTRVVLKRAAVEVRHRHDRSGIDPVFSGAGDTRIGPYLVADGAGAAVTTAVTIEAHDDRLGRRVWIDLLPPGSAPLDARRRDLGRPGRVRWLAGRRSGDECWDAYEAVEGEPVHETAARPQPWSRVRHWLGDLADEIAAGIDDESLPALHASRVWIDRDDRARIVDWSAPGSGGPVFDPEAAAPDLAAAQRLLYAVSVGALLGIPPDAAKDRQPETPLPLPARTLLLALRDARFTTTAALREGVAAAVNVPAVFPKSQRAAQIGVSAVLPILLTAITVGSMLFSAKGNGLAELSSPAMLWAVGLASASAMLLVVTPFAVIGALALGSGFTLRWFGAALVNRRGEQASRLRALWRAIVTWSLACGVATLFSKVDIAGSVDLRVLAVQTAGMALVVAAAVWTVLHPSRSIQDRLAGTWLVPR